MAEEAKPDLAAAAKKAANERFERQKKLALRIVGYTALTLLLTLLIMLVSGDTFAPILRVFGLYNDEGGLYTDCSKFENTKHRFCQAKEAKADKTWRSLKDKTPFSLRETP